MFWFLFVSSVSLLELFNLSIYFVTSLSIFIKAYLKPLLNNINICVLSVLVSLNVFYHVSWDFPDYLMMSNFGLYPAYLEYYVMRFWALFKSYGEFFFFFPGNQPCLVQAIFYNQPFVDCGFSVISVPHVCHSLLVWDWCAGLFLSVVLNVLVCCLISDPHRYSSGVIPVLPLHYLPRTFWFPEAPSFGLPDKKLRF